MNCKPKRGIRQRLKDAEASIESHKAELGLARLRIADLRRWEPGFYTGEKGDEVCRIVTEFPTEAMINDPEALIAAVTAKLGADLRRYIDDTNQG